MTRPTTKARKPKVMGEGPFEALVTSVGDELLVRRAGRGASRKPLAVRSAVPAFRPTIGDRVLVLEGESAYVVGVLHAAQVVATDGATATVRDGAIDLRDPDGALVATWDPTARELRLGPVEGDLRLAAKGRVRIEAGADLELTSGATTRLDTATLEATTHRAGLDAREAHLRAENTRVDVANHVAQYGRFELSAQRLFEVAGEAYREAEGLLQQRAGRVRTLVKETYRLLAGRTDIASREDTVIDGKRVLLG